MRVIVYEPEEARILADHVIDAALCGYEYSGLAKLLNVAEHPRFKAGHRPMRAGARDRKSTRLNSSHGSISYAVFCLKKKKKKNTDCFYYNTLYTNNV